MGVPDRLRGNRVCAGCGKALAADNTARMCSSCHREGRDQLRTPPTLRPEFFDTPEFDAAFDSMYMGKVFKAYRNHVHWHQQNGGPLSQEQLGRWLGLNQPAVSKQENGHEELNIKNLRSWAQILKIPRSRLWFKFPENGHLDLSVYSKADGGVSSSELIVASNLDAIDLLERVRRSAVNQSTIDRLSFKVQELCCAYAHTDAKKLMAISKMWLNDVTELASKQLTFSQHREVVHNAGMLALLVGCLEYDLGFSSAAEATRSMALALGNESGDSDISGWAHEMLAWFHLTTGNYRAVVAAAQAGLVAAPTRSVAVQLYGQQAKAYARMGQPEQVHEALERGRSLLDNLPYPEQPENHFVVDPDKWDFYAMDAYRIVGHDDLAKRNAEEVIRRSTKPDGFISSPMRRAEAELTLGVVAARQGEIDEAVSLGQTALQGGRQSRPSLLMVAGELQDELHTYGENAGSEFRDLLNDLKRVPRPRD